MAGASLSRRLSTGRHLALVAGLGAGALALSTLSSFSDAHAVLINVSPSLPNWAFWVDRTVVPTRGDYIFFLPPRSALLERHFGKEPRAFGKRVMGVAGDVVTRQGPVFFINGRPVATAKPRTRTGEPLALGPTGVIPRGCYFVATPHKDGFDSRYAAIGWICRARILGTGRAIL